MSFSSYLYSNLFILGNAEERLKLQICIGGGGVGRYAWYHAQWGIAGEYPWNWSENFYPQKLLHMFYSCILFCEIWAFAEVSIENKLAGVVIRKEVTRNPLAL